MVHFAEVPVYNYSIDDARGLLLISVELPGIESASAIDVEHDGQTLTLRAPGYELDLDIPLEVEHGFAGLKFLRTAGRLNISLQLTEFLQAQRLQQEREQQQREREARAQEQRAQDQRQGDARQRQGQPQPQHACANGYGAQPVPRPQPPSTSPPPQPAQAAAPQSAAANGAGRGGRPPSPSTPSHRDDSHATADVYEAGRARVNRETAAECAEAAQHALELGNYARAVKLLSKAMELHPGEYDRALRSALAEMERHEQREQRQQQQQQQDAASSPSDSQQGAGGRSGAGPRPHAVPEDGRGASASKPAAAGKGSGAPPPSQRQPPGSSGRADAGAGAGVRGGGSGPGPRSKAGGGRGSGSGAGGPGQQQGTGPAGMGGSTRHSKPASASDVPPKARGQERGRRRGSSSGDSEDGGGGGAGKRAGAGADAKPAFLTVLEEFFEELRDAAEDIHSWLAIPVLVLQLVVMLAVSVVVFVVWQCAALLPTLLHTLGLPGPAVSVAEWMEDSTLATLIVALPGGMAIPAILLYLTRGIWRPASNPVVFVVRSLLWEPNLMVALLATALLQGLPPKWARWRTTFTPVPLMLYGAGKHLQLLAAFILYLVLRRLSGAPVLSATASSLLVLCANSFVWYKALPAVLLVGVAWLVVVVHVEEVSGVGETPAPEETGAKAGGRARSKSPRQQRPTSAGRSRPGQHNSTGKGTSTGKGAGPSSRGHTPPPPPPRAPGVLLKSEAPHGATGEVARVLKCITWYDVLNVPRYTQDEEVLRKARRVASLATHPDKVGLGMPGAKEAFQRVTQAFEVLGTQWKRSAYDRQLRTALASAPAPPPRPAATPPPRPSPGASAATSATKAKAGMGTGAGAGSKGSAAAGAAKRAAPTSRKQQQQEEEEDDGGFSAWASFAAATGAGMRMPCPGCGGDHEAHVTERDVAEARWCGTCGRHHAARSGDAWVESRGFNLFLNNRKAFVCIGCVVMEITEYAQCAGMFYDAPANSCAVPFRFGVETGGFGTTGSTGGRRPAQAPSQPGMRQRKPAPASASRR